MIKEKEQLLRRLLIVMDLFVVLFSFLAAFSLRQSEHILYGLSLFSQSEAIGEISPLSRYSGLIVLMLSVWWAALTFFGLYESFRRRKFFEIAIAIIKSALFSMAVLATVAFIFKLSFISRTFIVSSFIIATLSLTAERWIIISSFRFFRRRGYNYRNILIVGTGPRSEKFIKLLHRHNEWGMRIIGLIDADRQKLGKNIAGEKVIGLIEHIPHILQNRAVDEVIFIVPRKWLAFIEGSLLACEMQGVKTNIATDFFDMKIARSMPGDIAGIPLVGFKTTVGEEWQLLIKRLFDIMFSVIGIIVTLPLFVGLLVAIRRLSPGRAIFKQVRSGLNGRNFVMYKFRTMVDDAESKKQGLNGFNEMNGPVFKMRNDPRVTRLGRFLRRTSLDELPQLFNVLKGDMSVVGPRPPIPSEVSNYEAWQRRRLSMKPGLTCLWQVNGRNNVDFDKWMQMDLQYIDNWSLTLDFKLLLKTVPAVLFSIGAR